MQNFLEEFPNVLNLLDETKEKKKPIQAIQDKIKSIQDNIGCMNAKIEYRPEPFSKFDKTFPSYTIKIGKRFKRKHVFDWNDINS